MKHLFVTVFATVLASSTYGQGQKQSRLEALPRASEVKLALSAAPPHLRGEATVYVLHPTEGYVLERKGSNGFTCYVERTDYLPEDFGNGFGDSQNGRSAASSGKRTRAVSAPIGQLPSTASTVAGSTAT